MSFLGYTVSATNQLFNIVAIPSGIWRYHKEGRMVWPLAGTLPGVFIGAMVRVAYLPGPANFKLFAAGELLYIGIRMVRDLLRPAGGGRKKSGGKDRSGEKRHEGSSEIDALLFVDTTYEGLFIHSSPMMRLIGLLHWFKRGN